MKPNQLVDVRARLDTIEKLLAQLATELKAIREELHAAAASDQTPPPAKTHEPA